MKREVILTRDGTHTLAVPEMKAMYHSIHGAVKESMHVYIQAGLQYACTIFQDTTLRVFEMGFGSGLNALLTAIETRKAESLIHYTSIETNPLTKEEVVALNYGEQLHSESIFQQLHQAPWSQEVAIHSSFTLLKHQVDLIDFSINQPVHLIYYDAFAPSAQPDLWTQVIFEKLYAMLVPGGILVTYCAKGNVKRAMQAAGFNVAHLQGPPGKREMLRAAHPNPPEGRASPPHSPEI